MGSHTQACKGWVFSVSGFKEGEHPVPSEMEYTLSINKTYEETLLGLTQDPDMVALGYCFNEGYLRLQGDNYDCETQDDRIEITLPDTERKKQRRRTSGCGDLDIITEYSFADIQAWILEQDPILKSSPLSLTLLHHQNKTLPFPGLTPEESIYRLQGYGVKNHADLSQTRILTNYPITAERLTRLIKPRIPILISTRGFTDYANTIAETFSATLIDSSNAEPFLSGFSERLTEIAAAS